MRIKISKTKAWNVERIQMEKGGSVLISVRQMYATSKDPEYKPGRQGITISTEDVDGKSEAKRLIKALIKALKNEDNEKPKLISKGKD